MRGKPYERPTLRRKWILQQVTGERHILAGLKVLVSVLVVVVALGFTLIAGGVFLVYLGAVGDTELTLFGSTFKSENVGVVGIFCGAVLAIIGVRHTLKTLVELGRL